MDAEERRTISVGLDRQRTRECPGRVARLAAFGQAGHALGSRRGEQAPDTHLGAQHRAHPRDQPHRQQRVTAQVEERVLRPRPVQPQHLSEQPAPPSLRRRGRLPATRQRTEIRRRQRRPVQLPVRRQRQPVHHHHRRRDHIVRQPLRRQRPQPRRIHHTPAITITAASADHIRHQPLIPRPVPPRHPPNPIHHPPPPPPQPDPPAPPPPAPPPPHPAPPGTPGPSPGHPPGRRTPAPRPPSTAPDPPAGTSSPPTRTDTPQTAHQSPPSAPDPPAPNPPPPHTTPPPPPPAPAATTHPAQTPAYSPPDDQSAAHPHAHPRTRRTGCPRLSPWSRRG